MLCCGMSQMSRRNRSAKSIPCEFQDKMLPVKVSLGIEAYGPDDTPDELVRRADMAMYYVKRNKKGSLGRIAAE